MIFPFQITAVENEPNGYTEDVCYSCAILAVGSNDPISFNKTLRIHQKPNIFEFPLNIVLLVNNRQNIIISDRIKSSSEITEMKLILGENSNWLSLVANEKGDYKYKFKITMKDGSKFIKNVSVKVNAYFLEDAEVEEEERENVGSKFAKVLI